jgi:hypothetical protein
MARQSVATRRYSWPRFWTAPGENTGEDFFDRSLMFALGTNALQLSKLVDERCLVLLGEPGLGKSHAIDDAVAEHRQSGNAVHLVDLGAYEHGESLIGAIVDDVAWREWRDSEDVLFLFLDGLDEALLHVKAIHKRLIVEMKKLEGDLARLRLRISCRSAEWLPDFESQLADIFDSTDCPRRLALAPLCSADAAEAARAEGIDAERFIAEIDERDLARLAASPLTLRMMIDIAASGEGALPGTRAELFDRAILRLAEEHDAGRRRELASQALHVGRRVAVAERIVAAMVLAGKTAIESDLTTTSRADLTIRELEGFSEQDPDAAGGASFTVGAEEVQEVLATALFVHLGGVRLTFFHRSLAEYLAARYMVHHHMEAEQIMSLLASADDPDGRLIPQLREVAAWTATLDNDALAEVMKREPELLLRADSLTFTDEARSQLVASLLTEETSMRVERYDRRMRTAFAGLLHPGLPDQIREALRPDRSILVHQMALSLARAAAMPELQPDLLAFAFDTAEPAHLRSDAVWALKDYADGDTRSALVPLATESIEDDEDDAIKGQALAATFPSSLGVVDVLKVLTPARDEHLFGAYKLFVSRTFPGALQPEDLPAALEWARTAPRDHGAIDLLSSLADDILAAAWPHLDDERIRSGVIAVIKPRLVEHHELLGPLHDRGDKRTFQEEHGRQLLICNLMEAATAREIEPHTLACSEPVLARPEDYSWVVGKLREVIGGTAEVAWATLAASLFYPETCDVEEMFELAERSSAFGERTAGWRTAVELDSDVARFGGRRAKRARGEAPLKDAPDMERVILDDLEAVEVGEADAWWRLNLNLMYDESGRGNTSSELEADLTQFDGWTRADEDTRMRIIEAARHYLNHAPPDPLDWFGNSTINRPAFAGYRALYLLAKHRPAQLEALDADVWRSWMPIIVGFPRFSGTDEERFDDVLVGLAADRAPEALTEWTLRMVDVQNATGEGGLFVLWRLRGVTAPQLVEALGRKLSDPALQSAARGDLAEYGMRADPHAFLPFITARLTPEVIEADRDAAVLVAAAALGKAPGASWPLIQEHFRSDPALGRAVFEKVANGERTDLASELDDPALHALVDWAFENFPPAEDPALPSGGGFVTPRMQSGQARDRLVAVLAQRGTDNAVVAIDALASKYPSYGMERRKAEAGEARLARWTAPEPGHVILLAQSNDARIVLSDAHLQQALMASLRRIEKRLQESSPPASRELWNTSGKPTPKGEEELSTWLRGRLEDDLRVGGRIIGRELLIRSSPSGRGRGESVDLAVFAPIGPDVESAPTASVMIEVKGCWHAKVKTAMKSQLVDRYLTGIRTTHGIYLVFWFAADDWDAADGRSRHCARDPQKLHDTLSEQARSVTAETPATVRSFVMDGSLPPATGPARRTRR